MIGWATCFILLAARVFADVPFTVDGSTIHVQSGRVGIATSSPGARLDVNGDAQFGSGATKSTFTAAGLLKLTSSGVQFSDGTTQTTAASGSPFNSPVVFNSSVTVNGSIFDGWEKVSYDNSNQSTSSVSCSAGKRLLGGGCIGTSTGYWLIRNGPSSDTAWECEWNGANPTRIAYAICAKFESN